MKKIWKGKLKRWVPDTTLCLQSELIRDPTLIKPCKMMEDTAFGSHPTCYMKSGFCDLDYFDKQRIFNVVSWADIKSQLSQSMAQSLRVKATCDLGVFEVFMHIFDFYYDITRAMDAVTRLAAAEIFLNTPANPKEAQNYISQKYVTLLTGNMSPQANSTAAFKDIFKNDTITSIESVFEKCKANSSNTFCRDFFKLNKVTIDTDKAQFAKTLNADVLKERILKIRKNMNLLK